MANLFANAIFLFRLRLPSKTIRNDMFALLYGMKVGEIEQQPKQKKNNIQHYLYEKRKAL